ncbi:MAG: hypothetical protein IPG73_12930 [Ignavibacteria bacterium]|nr:hypothetical protein [Ignavibacteria bacterium]
MNQRWLLVGIVMKLLRRCAEKFLCYPPELDEIKAKHSSICKKFGQAKPSFVVSIHLNVLWIERVKLTLNQEQNDKLIVLQRALREVCQLVVKNGGLFRS